MSCCEKLSAFQGSMPWERRREGLKADSRGGSFCSFCKCPKGTLQVGTPRSLFEFNFLNFTRISNSSELLLNSTGILLEFYWNFTNLFEFSFPRGALWEGALQVLSVVRLWGYRVDSDWDAAVLGWQGDPTQAVVLDRERRSIMPPKSQNGKRVKQPLWSEQLCVVHGHGAHKDCSGLEPQGTTSRASEN